MSSYLVGYNHCSLRIFITQYINHQNKEGIQVMNAFDVSYNCLCFFFNTLILLLITFLKKIHLHKKTWKVRLRPALAPQNCFLDKNISIRPAPSEQEMELV